MKYAATNSVPSTFAARSLTAALALAAFLIFLPVGAASQDLAPESAEVSRRILRDARRDVRRGRWEEAERALRALLARQPDDASVRLDLANLLLKKKQVSDAYVIAYDVVKTDPRNSYGFAVLGNVLIAAGNLKEASALLNNALYLKDKEALAWAGLGLIDFYENRMALAIDKLETAVYLDWDEPDYSFFLGQVAARAEKFDVAAKAYERFLQIAPPSDKDRRDRIAGLIRFLKFLGGKEKLYEIRGSGTAVAMEVVRERPVVTVRVNGSRRPMKFVLDTGSGMSVLSKRAADSLKVRPVTKGGHARAIGGSGRFPIVYGFVKRIDIGEVSIANVPVYIRPFHETNEHLDGYIGLSLISKFLTTVDYSEGKFVLDDLQSSENVFGPVAALPLRLTSSGFLSGEVTIEGVADPMNFIFDTGASVSVISPEVAGLEEVGRYVSDYRLRVVGAAGVIDDVRTFYLPRLTFGSHSVERLRAVELDLGVINEASGFRQSGILGGNFLKNYRITFDFRNSRVLLAQ
jgi:tetratricopeptide (TPR) repeat protein